MGTLNPDIDHIYTWVDNNTVNSNTMYYYLDMEAAARKAKEREEMIREKSLGRFDNLTLE